MLTKIVIVVFEVEFVEGDHVKNEVVKIAKLVTVWTLALVMALGAGLGGLEAQVLEDAQTSEDTEVAEAEEPASRATMGPGNIDVGLSGGLGGLIYPYLEPQVAVGVLELDDVSISVGGLADVGYCVLCHLLEVLDDDWSLRSYYFGVYGRALVHLNVLADEIGGSIGVDPYAGVAVGPRFYFFDLEYEPSNDSVSTTLQSVVFMPHIGARVFPSESAPLFLFGDLRFSLEFGLGSTTVTVGNQSYTVDDEVAGGGIGIALGAGLRL